MIGGTPVSVTKHSRARRRREGNTLLAATLTNGPTELIDFLLPLWAGAAIGLGATEVGILLAVEMAVSVVMRPLAGVLADTYERRYVAAAGAALYALSTLGYALAQSAPSPTRQPRSAARAAHCSGSPSGRSSASGSRRTPRSSPGCSPHRRTAPGSRSSSV